MRFGLALLLIAVAGTPAFAFDPSTLPQACQSALAQMRSEKPQFTQLSAQMAKLRKSADHTAFCNAALQTLALIKQQDGLLDGCLGEMAGAQGVPTATVDQMTQLKSLYKSMLEAAKNEKNDQMHCGLADQ